jgi:hypothetical protein
MSPLVLARHGHVSCQQGDQVHSKRTEGCANWRVGAFHKKGPTPSDVTNVMDPLAPSRIDRQENHYLPSGQRSNPRSRTRTIASARLLTPSFL